MSGFRGSARRWAPINGWERANWFAKPGDDTSEEATQSWERAGPWEPRIREECEAVRDGVGVLDLTGFSRFRLSGDGAAEWLRGRIAGGLPKPGRASLGYFADERGRIVTEMSIFREAEDVFTLITAAPAQWHDFELLLRATPEDGSLTLTDQSGQFASLLITGPKSRELLSRLTEGDLSTPWLSFQSTQVVGRPAMLARVSFAGELGWEIHTPMAQAPAIYEAVLEGGAKPFGMYALDALRLEKGYRGWKLDLSTDYTLLEAGLDRFVKLDKPQDFPGKTALLAEKQRGSTKRFATLKVAAGACDAPPMSLIWKGDAIVGEVTSGGWGYRVGASIALAMLRADLATEGETVEVEVFGDRVAAVVQPDGPLWDPQNARLRA